MRNPTQTLSSRRDPAIVAACAGADALAVLVFVLVGRLAHGESAGPAGLMGTGWPFLVGVVGGYVAVALTRWPALSAPTAAVVLVKTLVIGLVLRYGIQGEATPPAFVLVTAVTLTVLMVGWRLAARRSSAWSAPAQGAHHGP